MGYEATRPRATRVMQYVQRPAHPWAIGTIASLQTNEVDSISAARSPHAVPAPSSSTICGHFRGGSSLARGTMDWMRSLWAAAMQTAPTHRVPHAASCDIPLAIVLSLVS